MYSKENDNFEITIRKDTLIEPCDDDASIPFHPRISFCLITDIDKKRTYDKINVIGIIKSIQANKTFTRREIEISDTHNFKIKVYLWKIEKMNAKVGDVMCIEDAQIYEYKKNKNLDVTSKSVLKINPDIPDITHCLRMFLYFQINNEKSTFDNAAYTLY
jgi:hypothetical protein